MSASLVGSEMCIRDRSSSDPGVGDRRLEGGHDGARPDRWGRGRGEGGRSVSYTHLTLPTICSV
eukprot:23300-Alexandrium_andersonii.AAC.1